jgi:hypothetical protein
MQRHVTGILRSSDAARPRPLADLPVGALEGRSEELARRWAIAIILARPLAQMAELALRELAREGAALCEQVLAALESDGALDALLDHAPRARAERSAGERLLAVAGDSEAGAVILAAEALRGVLWQALAAELDELQPRLLADAADRLGHVLAMLAVAALAAQPPQRLERSALRGGLPDLGARVPGVAAAADAWAGEREPAAIVDEHDGHDGEARPAPGAARAPEVHDAGEEIAVRDQRGGEGPSAWLESIGRELRRGGEHGPPFAVLLVQAGEREPRLRRSPADGDVDAAVRPLLEGVGTLTREGRGRYWLVVSGHDRAVGEELADRLTSEVAAAAGARGVAVQVAIGTASYPQDGRDAAALAAHADVALYAARAAARAAALRPAPGAGPPPYLPADGPR